jgi:hypothetical protein
MGLIRPPALVYPPPGILRPNAEALSRGMSFAQAFQNGPRHPFVARGAVATAAFHGSSEFYAARGGIGLSGDGWGGGSASNTYALSQTSGTVLMYLAQYVDGGSTIRRWFSQFGPSGDNQHRMEVVDGNFSFGWIAGGVNRLVGASAVGYYTAGRPFTIASTWDASGQAAYASGRQFGTGTAGYANTAGSNISIGYLPGFGFESGRIKPSALYYTLVFDTAFTPEQVAQAEADPWWWIERSVMRPVRRALAVGPLSAEIAGTVDITASVAATLALDAAIAGTVDVTASVAATTTLDAEIAGTVPITADISARLDRLAEIAGTIPITASITAFMEGGAGDTHDGFLRRSRRQRALDAAERRRDAERLADARALRLELEAALGMAADAVEGAPAPAVDAVREAVAVVRALPHVAPAIDFASARAAVSDLLAAIETARRAKALADDDEDVEILLRAL